MASRTVKPDWSWLGQPVSIDLANTVMPSPTGPVELLTDSSALDGWLLAQAGRLEPLEAGAAERRLGEFLVLRDAVRAVLGAAADPTVLSPPSAAIEVVNRAAAAAPAVRALVAAPGRLRAEERLAAPQPSTRVLAAIAVDAIVLAGEADQRRLGQCTAPGCGAFFVGTRARQHWCSDACGNRARVARHAQRSRAET